MLMQLNQQLQFISRQLYEMETTNTLQLRLMYRIANESAKVGRMVTTSWILLREKEFTFRGMFFSDN